MPLFADGTRRLFSFAARVHRTVVSGCHPYVKNLLLERKTSYTMMSMCAHRVKLTGAEKRKLRKERNAEQGQGQPDKRTRTG